MKKKSILLIIIIFFISSYSISGMTKKQNTVTVSGDLAGSETRSTIDIEKKKTMEKKGKIEVSGDNVYYLINWTSKSRISLDVIGNLKKEVSKLEGKIIEAEGNIKYKSQWSGTIEITSYKIVK
ncbi:MAG: hypothetical protein JW864_18985 [Spirochaetes bacterium]|nr:hypothetical protein [Spirochaetota bacterium]